MMMTVPVILLYDELSWPHSSIFGLDAIF